MRVGGGGGYHTIISPDITIVKPSHCLIQSIKSSNHVITCTSISYSLSLNKIVFPSLPPTPPTPFSTPTKGFPLSYLDFFPIILTFPDSHWFISPPPLLVFPSPCPCSTTCYIPSCGSQNPMMYKGMTVSVAINWSFSGQWEPVTSVGRTIITGHQYKQARPSTNDPSIINQAGTMIERDRERDGEKNPLPCKSLIKPIRLFWSK